MTKLVIASVTALGLSVAAASAATVTDMAAFGPSLTEFASSASSSVNPLGGSVNAPALELDLFDGSLGTLNSVEVTLSGGFSSTGAILNGATDAQNANAVESATFFFSSSLFADSLFSADDQTGFQSFATGAIGTAVDLTASSSSVLNPGTAGFTGAAGDTFSIDFGTLISTTFQGGGGNLTFDVETLGSVEATVVYDYDVAVVTVPTVPLPAGVLLLGTALAGLGFARRKS
jgi:hypothetical protein